MKDFILDKFQDFNISIRYNQDNYEIINNNSYDKFNICISLLDLKTGEIYDFVDIKIRGVMYIDMKYNFYSNKIIKLFNEMSKALQF